MRGFGVEVWFDENELHGGDTWDEKIRGQIRGCTLFLAVISAHTQARREGYFRREWKLAVERTHDMAAGVPFLVPVAIDDTAESRALVPAEFLRVQWTRLPGGLPTPQFIEQIKHLLAPGNEAARAFQPMGRDDPGSKARSPTNRGVPIWTWVVVAAAAIGAVAFFTTRKSEPLTAPPKTATETKAGPAAPILNDKSIAVLPFTNLSPDKGNAFFADGIHEDVLTNLQNIRELRVVSRQSVIGYRDTTKKMPEIARELGVTYILECSVRRAADSVRVSAQLIDARTDTHIWSPQPYTRKLTDVFAIQSEIAQAIASALQTVLSPQEKNLIARRPTENPAAYDLYLKSRAARGSNKSLKASFQERESLLQSAVALDPAFAIAWGELAVVHVEMRVAYVDTTPARLAKATVAIDRARALAPESPEVIRAVGVYFDFGLRDHARASEQFEKLLRLQPNDAETRSRLAIVQLIQGRWPEYIATRRTVAQLDPTHAGTARVLASAYRMVRRFDEALAEQRRLVALQPDGPEWALELARMTFLATGSTRDTDELLVRLEARDASSPEVIGLRMTQALRRNDYAEFIRLDRLHPPTDPEGLPDVTKATIAAAVFRSQGDLDGARARLGTIPATLRARLELEPDNNQHLRDAALVEAILGNKDEALRRIARAAEDMPEAHNAFVGVGISVVRAQVDAWNGDKDRAIGEIARLLRIPGSLNIYEMKHDPLYAPLRGDPRFEALLNDPKNNAPLF